jgi:hypothetical protein
MHCLAFCYSPKIPLEGKLQEKLRRIQVKSKKRRAIAGAVVLKLFTPTRPFPQTYASRQDPVI